MSDTSIWRIPVGDDSTGAAYDPSESGDGGVVFVCAHGAGGNMGDKAVVSVTKTLRSIGLGTVRFNFLYRERKSGRPDAMPKLEQCFDAVVARVRDELGPGKLIIGGRSMGGRAASMMASTGYDCDGLLLMAYPLHPPGQPEKLRDAHLPSIRVPVLCFNGTRDPFCTPALMDAALENVNTRWDMHWLEGADHSLHVPKSSGRTDAAVLDEVAASTKAWVQRL